MHAELLHSTAHSTQHTAAGWQAASRNSTISLLRCSPHDPSLSPKSFRIVILISPSPVILISPSGCG